MNSTWLERHFVRYGLAAIFAVVPTLSAALASEDTVAKWNERALAFMHAEKTPDTVLEARALAILNIAQVTAMKARAGALEGDRVLAAHAAAHRVLASLYPAEAAALDQAFAAAVAGADDSKSTRDDLAAGEAAAVTILAERKGDGSATVAPDAYRPITSPGVYVSTALPVWTNYPAAKPFVLSSTAQFRPGPPPDLASTIWARDYNETPELGGTKSSKRTAVQTETADFWRQLSGTEAWNQIALQLLASKSHSTIETAILLRDMNEALYDSYLAVAEAKFHYNFWRPITAIRNGDITGNTATPRDPSWTPLFPTPAFPEYPCAHCIVDTAAGAVIEALFGSGTLPEFSLSTSGLPGVIDHFASLKQVQDEVDMARIWGGVHFRNSTEVADEMGRKIGAFVVTHQP